MKTIFKVIIISIVAGYFSDYCYGQDTTTIDFYSQIKVYNLSKVLMADSVLLDYGFYGRVMDERPEVLGFIGDDYQRFYIHFISMIKDPTNPDRYIVSGKTRVKDNICSFKGTVIIKQARQYEVGDCAKCKQGFVNCEVTLYEDKSQEASGIIKSKLKCNFLIDKKYGFRYDATNMVSDGFSNNEFTGTWTSYKTNTSKKCNWGDSRIPDCGDLDIGAGEFSVNDKYLKNGWENYRISQGIPDKPEVKKAQRKEAEKWWK